MRLSFDRIGAALLQSKAICDPILHRCFVRQAAKRGTLREVIVQQVMLHICEAAHGKKLEVSSGLRRGFVRLLESVGFSSKPWRALGIFCGSIMSIGAKN